MAKLNPATMTRRQRTMLGKSLKKLRGVGLDPDGADLLDEPAAFDHDNPTEWIVLREGTYCSLGAGAQRVRRGQHITDKWMVDEIIRAQIPVRAIA